PEAWRRLGVWQPAPGLNHDGIPNLFNTQGGKLTAISGRDGRVLWRGDSGDFAGPVVPPAPGADLDGDGVPDFLAVGQSSSRSDRDYERVVFPVQAFSGKTGKQLWRTADRHVPGSSSHVFAHLRPPQCRDLKGEGRPDVLQTFILDWPFGAP